MWGDEFGRMNRRVIEKGQVEELTFDSWRTTTELSACLFPACGAVRWRRGFVTLQVCMCSSPGVGLKDCRTGQAVCGLCRLLRSTFSKLVFAEWWNPEWNHLSPWLLALTLFCGANEVWDWVGLLLGWWSSLSQSPPFGKHTACSPARCLAAPYMRGSHFVDVKGTLSLDIAPCPHFTLFLPEWGYSLMSNPWTGICWSMSIEFLYFYQWELICNIMLIKPLIFPLKSYFCYLVDLVSIKM